MPTRVRLPLALFVCLLVSVVFAKDKNKANTLPAFVTDAHTAVVIVFPDASNPVTNPNANRDAQSNVERALTNWGHLRLGVDPQTSDLVIAIRKGSNKGPGTTIGGGGVNDRPVIIQPSDDGIRIGGQQGRAPNVGWDPRPATDKPTVAGSTGSSEDIFEVYRGNQQFPLDSAPLWRFNGKDGLKSPNVPAVAAFRKAVEDALKQAKTPPAAKP
jgi:hypothetical protein